jgi:hypothetical protein
MPGTSPVALDALDASAEPAISRRTVLTASAGLVGAAAMASNAALAQAPAAAPQMPAVQAPVRNDWLAKRSEEILEPELPIIDPHHHLWDKPRYTYLFPSSRRCMSRPARCTAPMGRRSCNPSARPSSSTAWRR